ncbi:hypothetical protein M8494_37035 [Serratia ureilytica]
MAADNAASRVSGSKRLRKCGMDFSLIYNPSATNTKSNFPVRLFRRGDIKFEVDAGVGGGVRVAPGGHISRCAMQNGAQPQLPLIIHRDYPVMRRRGARCLMCPLLMSGGGM